MTPVDQHDERRAMERVSRSMQRLTIGVVKDMDSARVQRELEGLAEREEQFVVDVAGRAEEFPEWDEVEIKFGTTFVNGTSHRDSELLRPHFVYGSYIEEGGPVGLLACVTKWDVNGRDETTGCTLAIGAVASDVSRNFRGELHARFQGYGQPVDVYGDPSMLDVG